MTGAHAATVPPTRAIKIAAIMGPLKLSAYPISQRRVVLHNCRPALQKSDLKHFCDNTARGYAAEVDPYASIRFEQYCREGGLQIQCLD